MSVFLSSGSPTLSVPIRFFSLRITLSAMLSCTNNRDPAQHTWPWLKKIPLMTPSTASLIGASSKIMLAAFPPNSRVYRLPVPATARRIDFPTAVEPVNATLSMPECSTKACPVSPSPLIMFTTPAGSSASSSNSANFSAVSGVVSAGFNTTVLPQAKAGAIFQAAIKSGKFHGITCPTTPSDFGFLPGKA